MKGAKLATATKQAEGTAAAQGERAPLSSLVIHRTIRTNFIAVVLGDESDSSTSKSPPVPIGDRASSLRSSPSTSQEHERGARARSTSAEHDEKRGARTRSTRKREF